MNGHSSEIFGYIRQSLESVRKMLGNVSLTLATLLENLRKVVGNLRKNVKNVLTGIHVYIINRILHARLSI